MHRSSLGDGGLVADGLPASIAPDPDAGVAVGSAKIFAQLVAFHIGAGGHHRGVAIEADHHVADVHGFVAELATTAGAEGVFFCCVPYREAALASSALASTPS